MIYFKTWIDLFKETTTKSPSTSKINADSLTIRNNFSEESVIKASELIAYKRGGQAAKNAHKRLFEDTENLDSLKEYVEPMIKKRKFSHDRLHHIQSTMELPDVKIKDLAKNIRDELGSDSIEPNFERKLTESVEATAKFFSKDTVQMEIRYKNKETKGQSKS